MKKLILIMTSILLTACAADKNSTTKPASSSPQQNGDTAAASQAATSICPDGTEPPTSSFGKTIRNYESFHYVRKAMKKVAEELPNSTICLSMVVGARSDYAYYRYYLKADVYAIGQTKPSYSFQYIFQDASIQAFHNHGGQPWYGLDSAQVDRVVQNFIETSRFEPFPHRYQGRPVAIAKQTAVYLKSQENIDFESLSSLELKFKSAPAATRFFIVTWLTKPNNNATQDKPMAQGVLMAVDKQQNVLISENILPYSDLFMPLEDYLKALRDNFKPKEQWPQVLLDFARQN
ncbi:MAG: hypothetical protein AB7N80_11695 [Bdellovibrionales bacterium]